MNFQNLPPIEKPENYLDSAFRAARTLEKHKIKDRLKSAKTVEIKKLDTVSRLLTRRLSSILKSFPSIDTLPEFYNELVKLTLEYPVLKKSLGAVDWAAKRVNILRNNYSLKIKRSTDVKQITSLRTQYYGRISSVIKQIKQELAYLDQARKAMRRFPAIKTSLFTAAIAGYPNVGKSSLLETLTSAKPEIKSYAFTTKSLNLGYFTHDGQKIQVIDTPGLFDRQIIKMNSIEKQAYLALKYVAGTIIFMIDPTESCGYEIRKQQKLLLRTKKSFSKRTILVHSKADLIKKRQPDILYISTKTMEGIETLKKMILREELSRTS